MQAPQHGETQSDLRSTGWLVKDAAFYREVFFVGLPVAFQQMINIGVNLMDTVMVGALGEAALSAASLANQYYYLYYILCLGISGGCCVLSAQFWGAGDGARVKQVWHLAMLLSGGAAVIFSVVTGLMPGPIMRVYTTDPQMIDLGARYLRVTAGVFFFHGTSLVMVNLLRTVGMNYVGLLVSSVSFVVNILFNYMFIFGKFGAPRLGITGAAVGTLLSRMAEFAITFTVLLRGSRALPFRMRDFTGRLEKSLLRRFAAVGLPPIISDSLFTLGDNVLCVILGHMSAAVVSGQAITLATMRFCTAFIMGLSNAASVCVGHAVGRGERETVQQQGKTFYLLSVAGGLIGGVIIWTVSPFIVGCYQLSEQAVDATMQMMLAMSLLMVFRRRSPS